jgi:tRNA dimethylallyltransferase
MSQPKQITVLVGPTASGKSARALAMTASRPTVIINADAMQMVSALRVITARPTPGEEAMAEHALYGVLPPQSPTSVAVWLKLVEPAIRKAWTMGKHPLLVGGTGMYLSALMNGLSSIPSIPADIRAAVRATPGASLHAKLLKHDPVMAAKLKPGDTQRLLRALEVVMATGISLDHWQKTGPVKIFPEAQFTCFAMAVDRAALYDRINRRFETMMDVGALDEVQALMALNLPPDTPILRAHGVPELMAHLRGEMTRADAITQAQQNTRNYAKRQLTWIRNQLPHAAPVDAAP